MNKIQDSVPTARELILLDCIIGAMVQAGVIDEGDAMDNQGLSAYEHAEVVLAEYGLLIEVDWRDCSINTRRDPHGRYPGTYFDSIKFRKLTNEENFMGHKDSSEPAFPVPTVTGLPNGDVIYGFNGMTLRDYFAAASLSSITGKFLGSEEDIARQAYKIADAMIAERGRE